MITRKKYQILISITVIVFVYVLTNDVWNRWMDTVSLFHTLRDKESMVFEPEQLVEKKMFLLQRKAQLTHIITKDSKTFEQNQTGVFEFLTTAAQHSGLVLQSLVPVVSKSKGGLQELGFKLQASSSYHKIGGFISEMENGPFGISMQRIDLEKGKDTQIAAKFEGVAYVLAPRDMRK